jgi:5-methylcytosine-specific restriction endonuclease McrA
MKVQCEKCGATHDGSYGSGRFCSQPCARSFASAEKREEINAKVSKTLKGRKPEFSLEQMQRGIAAQKATKLRQLLSADWNTLCVDTKKKRVVIEQDGKCQRCGIDKWLGEPLILQVDHADGNAQNDARENLRGLCPNCHSQTPTFCGKNRGKSHRRGDYEITDERMLVALLETRSIGAALKLLGKNRNGLNYRRCKKLLEQRALSHMVTSEFAKCGFCQQELKDKPQVDEDTRFCNPSCAGKYRAAERKKIAAA